MLTSKLYQFVYIVYAMSVIAVRGVDEEIYRRVKAVAALRGIRIGEAFNEALRLWLSIKPAVLATLAEVEREAERNRKVLRQVLSELPGREAGYVAVAGGRFLGLFKTLEEAAEAVEKSGAKHGIVEEVGRAGRREVELGWGLVEFSGEGIA